MMNKQMAKEGDKIVCILFCYVNEEANYTSLFNMTEAETATEPEIQRTLAAVKKALKTRDKSGELDYEDLNCYADKKYWPNYPCYVHGEVTLYEIE